MEFRNLTPFSAMEYAMDDKHGKRHHVVAMKTGFSLVPDADGQWRTVVMDYPALPLSPEDKFIGEMNASSVIMESDLAPLKPACDIIVNGTVHAPEGIAVSEMTVGILIRALSGDIVLDKTLRVTGKRFYQRPILTGQWYETEPEPFTALRLDYRYAFGGECRVDADSEYAEHIPDACRLTEQQRAGHPDGDNPPLAHVVCPVNPLGLGYTQRWYLHACHQHQVEAPRIVAVNSPFTLQHFVEALEGNADWSAPAFQPAGLGCISRTWLPRLPLAGTYDLNWLENHHPALPEDFNFRYWNAAPQDQQIPFPHPGATITLYGFRPEGDITFTLPANRASILLRMESGEWIPQMMWTDTLLIDTNALTVVQIWRYLLPHNLSVRVMEARYHEAGV